MTENEELVKTVGRSRDARIDERVLGVAGLHLERHGFAAMSVAAVAREAGTTRQAVYRRWPSKADLAAAVIGGLSDPATPAPLADEPSPFVDPYGDLVAELTDFAQGVSGPGRLFLVGTMLQDTTDASVRQQYREEVIAPRRRRLRAILDRAARLDLIDADADLEIAVTLGTGSWYARALAGDDVPEEWPARTAALVWRAVGGTPFLSPKRAPGDTPRPSGSSDGSAVSSRQ